MEKQNNMQTWLDTAVAGIRFKADRKAVEAELRGHFEDKAVDLQRIFHVSKEEAEEMALKQMGDAEEIGREMAKIHTPWLGYLWRASQMLLAVTLAAAVGYSGASVHDAIVSERTHAEYLEASGKKNQHMMELFFLEGVDPIGTYKVHRVKGDPMECELVEMMEPGVGAKVPNYHIRIAGAALWDFVMPDGSNSRSLFCDLRAVGPPWEPMSTSVLHYVTATDSLGNCYPSYLEWHRDYLEREAWGERSPIGINGGLDEWGVDTTPFEKRFSFEVRNIHPEAEWLRLEYAVEDVAWNLTIPFGEEGRT